MASLTSHTIRLKGTPQRQEAIAAGVITPGDLISKNDDGEFIRHAVEGGAARPLWAAENEVFGGDINDNYAILDNVLAWATTHGDEIYANVAANADAIVIGAALESAGDGTVRVVTAFDQDGTTPFAVTPEGHIVGYAKEAVDNSAGGTIVRIRVVSV
jgi:hypothetical protein